MLPRKKKQQELTSLNERYPPLLDALLSLSLIHGTSTSLNHAPMTPTTPMMNHGTLTSTSTTPLFPPSPGSGNLILPFPLRLLDHHTAASPERINGAIVIVAQKNQPWPEEPGQGWAEPRSSESPPEHDECGTLRIEVRSYQKAWSYLHVVSDSRALAPSTRTHSPRELRL